MDIEPETLKEIVRSLTIMHGTKVDGKALFLHNIIMELIVFIFSIFGTTNLRTFIYEFHIFYGFK